MLSSALVSQSSSTLTSSTPSSVPSPATSKTGPVVEATTSLTIPPHVVTRVTDTIPVYVWPIIVVGVGIILALVLGVVVFWRIRRRK